MKDLGERALQAALDAGASYADARVQEVESESFTVRNGVLETAARASSGGAGVRVVVEGAWGFASTPDPTPAAVEAAARRAVEVGRASATLLRRQALLAPSPPETGEYATPVVEDPFSVAVSEKVDLLVAASMAMRTDPRVRSAVASMDFTRCRTVLVTSEGSAVAQTIAHSAGGISATAVDDHDAQRRSHPSAEGRWASGGYEVVRTAGLLERAPEVAEQAVALLGAPECPSGETTLVLDSHQVALQIHESVGHPTELDRILGTEAAFAGTSFVRPEDRGRLRYGSELVTIVCDGTVAGGLGTVGWDDEGVPPVPTDLIRDGILVGFQCSRETAAQAGLTRSNGTMRADGWINLPLIRMTNVSLMPGDSSLEELIGTTREGIYMATNKSWSIDDMRKNFQFGCEIAWEIRDGKLGRMLKNPTYAGMTTDFWGSCDGIAGRAEWVMWGVPNCGKGQPSQVARVGHGAAPARFRGVRAGIRGTA